MRVLLTGGSSLLGKYLTESKPDDVELSSTWFTNHINGALQLDVSNKSQIAYVFEKTKPQVVIHCAAVGSVDYSEKFYSETHQVNVLGTKNVIQSTNDFDATFVYISTNAVFDGNNPPYSEVSECHPVNRYGAIKREAEIAVMLAKNWLVIRPFLLYGYPHPGGRANWFVTIKNNLLAGRVTRLVNDRYWQHTYVGDVAMAIWKLIELKKTGEIYNVAAGEKMTLYDFGLAIAKHLKADRSLIQPMSSDELPIGTAPRPVDTTYDLSKIHNLNIKLRGVKEGLKEL